MGKLSINNSELLTYVEEFVSLFLIDIELKGRYFHNLNHTIQVVRASKELGVKTEISEESMTLLSTAAWFHDTGYAVTGLNHEEESVIIAIEFLNQFDLAEDFLVKLEQLILATRRSSEPSSLLEKIIRDADLYHLSSDDYPKWSDLLKKEIEILNGGKLSDDEWNKENILFFLAHNYYTSHARIMWDDGKNRNLRLLRISSPGVK